MTLMLPVQGLHLENHWSNVKNDISLFSALVFQWSTHSVIIKRCQYFPLCCIDSGWTSQNQSGSALRAVWVWYSVSITVPCPCQGLKNVQWTNKWTNTRTDEQFDQWSLMNSCLDLWSKLYVPEVHGLCFERRMS